MRYRSFSGSSDTSHGSLFRAVPSGIWLGGALKKGRQFFSENKTSQKFFQTLASDTDNGGLKILFQNFFDLNFSENFLIFNTFHNSSIPGPPLGKLGPLFLLFFGGCYTPHTPSSSGPELIVDCSLLHTLDHHV